MLLRIVEENTGRADFFEALGSNKKLNGLTPRHPASGTARDKEARESLLN